MGIEVKRADGPTRTPGMAAALDDLKLDRLLVVYPGRQRYPLGMRIEVMSLVDCVREVAGA